MGTWNTLVWASSPNNNKPKSFDDAFFLLEDKCLKYNGPILPPWYNLSVVGSGITVLTWYYQ